MYWPTESDYSTAIEDPKRCFRDAELRQGRAAAGLKGLPMVCAGTFSVVYKVQCPSGQTWAVKCFTRKVENLAPRYKAISAYLKRRRRRFTVDFEYLEEGIKVGGKWYPVVKLQWVEGFLLNEFLREWAGNTALMEQLCQLWLGLGDDLREDGVAHGDLQHGNVLLVPGSSSSSMLLRLVDYDGVWTPTLAGTPPDERICAHYQHPQRLKEGAYGPEMDRFSHLAIYTALRCLMVGGKALWTAYDNDYNLLFREADFKNPAESKLFPQLLALPDRGAQFLVGRLLLASQGPIDQTPLVSDLVDGEDVAPLSLKQIHRIHELAPGVRPFFAPTSSPPPSIRPEGRKVGGSPGGSRARPAPENEDSPTSAVTRPAPDGPSLHTEPVASDPGAPFPIGRWLWLGAGAALLLLVLLAVGSGSRDKGKQPATPLTAQKTAMGVGDANASPNALPPALAPEFTNSIGMKLVRIPPGKFIMGSPSTEQDREPFHKGSEQQHEVEITKGFAMGVYTVTQAEYEQVVGRNPSWFSAEGGGKDKVMDLDVRRFPVENVSWRDATAFCAKLSDRAEEKAANRKYRLPTEAEWEYACRAGTRTTFHFGASLSSSQANFDGDHPYGGAGKGPFLGRTCQVGSYKPNAWGLYDMHGNVWQWCSDWYDKDYYRGGPKINPEGPAVGTTRVARGGVWYYIARDCRSADRANFPPGDRSERYGFRVVCVPAEIR